MSETTVETAAERFARQRREEFAARDARREADLPAFVSHAEKIGADFTVRVHTDGQLRAVLDAIGGHNRYAPARAALLLGPLVADAMSVEVRHCVDGPYISFTVAPWSHQTLGNRAELRGMGEKFDRAARHAYAQRVIDAGRELYADMLAVRQGGYGREVVNGRPGDRPAEITLWWD